MLGIVPVLQPSRTHNPHLLQQGEEGWHPASGAGAPCPAVAPLHAQGKALDVHRCSLSLGVISEVLHHPFVFDKVKCWRGGEQASRVLQGQLVEIHLPVRRHTALTPSHVLSFNSQFPLQSPSREAVCAALGTRGMIC